MFFIVKSFLNFWVEIDYLILIHFSFSKGSRRRGRAAGFRKTFTALRLPRWPSSALWIGLRDLQKNATGVLWACCSIGLYPGERLDPPHRVVFTKICDRTYRCHSRGRLAGRFERLFLPPATTEASFSGLIRQACSIVVPSLQYQCVAAFEKYDTTTRTTLRISISYVTFQTIT